MQEVIFALNIQVAQRKGKPLERDVNIACGARIEHVGAGDWNAPGAVPMPR